MISSDTSGNNIHICSSNCITSIKKDSGNDNNSSTNYNYIRNCNWGNNILIYFLAKNNSSISKRGGDSNSSYNANFSHYMIMIVSMIVRGITCLNLNSFLYW